MNDKDKKAYDEWLDRQKYWYDSWNDNYMQDGYVVSIYGETEEAWQAALEYARSEGPEDSVHEQGEIRRNMTWKESSEMMDRMANSLAEELDRMKKLWREERAKSKNLEREIEILRRYGNKDCTAMADEELAEYRGEKEENK